MHQLPAHAAVPAAWDERYRDRGLTIVGVHTPEFAFEKDAAQRRATRSPATTCATRSRRTTTTATWDAWGNQYWPAKYLIDARGQVRYAHFGEGDYDETEEAIRTLLRRGRRRGSAARRRASGAEVPGEATPETYLGVARAERWNPPPVPGTHDYPGATHALKTDHFALGGRWTARPTSAAEAVHGATLHGARARQVRLPRARLARAHGPHGARDRRRQAREDAHRRRQRLYTLLKPPRSDEHQLALRFEPGVAGYAFTFG